MKMKNIKRIIATALTTVLAVGMLSTVSFADVEESTTPVSSATGVTSIPISKTVEVSERGTVLPTENFQFTMVPATDLDEEGVSNTDSNNNKVEAGLALAEDTIEISFDATDSTATGKVSKDANFTLAYKDSAYNHTGIYRYYLYETGTRGLGDEVTSIYDDYGNVIENAYIDFDTTKYIIDLYVDQDSDSNFVVTKYVATYKDKTTKPNTISFTNEISCATLKIFKNVEGTAYKKGELFAFRILIPVGGDTIKLEDGQQIEAYIKDSNGTVIDTANGRTDANGKVFLTVKGDSIEADMETNATTFQLKDGEWLEIPGLPVSMIYKVEEVTDTIEDEGYVVTYDYVETGDNTNTTTGKQYDVSGSSLKGTINTDKNEVTFNNTRTIEVPNSGISMDILPYALIVLVAVCGGLLLILKKRKSAH